MCVKNLQCLNTYYSVKVGHRHVNDDFFFVVVFLKKYLFIFFLWWGGVQVEGQREVDRRSEADSELTG